jgi:phage-related protein
MEPSEKPIEWVASAKKDLLSFPAEVIRNIGFGLGFIQMGRTPDNAKVLHGLGSGVWELVEDHRDGTYRAAYVVRFEKAVYVLHCFHKKSKSGVATPKQDIDLIKQRLMAAEANYKRKYKGV